MMDSQSSATWMAFLAMMAAKGNETGICSCVDSALSTTYPVCVYTNVHSPDACLVAVAPELAPAQKPLLGLRGSLSLKRALSFLFENKAFFIPETAHGLVLASPPQSVPMPQGSRIVPLNTLPAKTLHAFALHCGDAYRAAGADAKDDCALALLRENDALPLATAGAVFQGGFGDVSILTRPDQRGKGYATLLLQVLANAVCKSGKMPLYRVETVNTASVALARKIGFAPLYLMEGARVSFPR